MRYGLRVNHHADDHDDLILDGIKPALDAARAQLGFFPAALRSHWLNGPHILLGVEMIDPDDMEQAYAILGQHIQAWMATNPSPGVDAKAHAQKSFQLAGAEAISLDRPNILRAKDTVERADYEVPAFLDDQELSVIRDRFMAACLDDLFVLLAVKRQSQPRLLAMLAERFLAIDALSDRPILSFWPMSLRAQFDTTRQMMPDTHDRFLRLAGEIGPLIRDIPHLYDDAAPGWIAKLDRLGSDLDTYVSALPRAYFDRLQELAVSRGASSDGPMTEIEIRMVASNPYHFAYRAFMNMIYALFPLLGLPASKRIFVCHLVIRQLTETRSDILSRTHKAARDLIYT